MTHPRNGRQPGSWPCACSPGGPLLGQERDGSHTAGSLEHVVDSLDDYDIMLIIIIIGSCWGSTRICTLPYVEAIARVRPRVEIIMQVHLGTEIMNGLVALDLPRCRHMCVHLHNKADRGVGGFGVEGLDRRCAQPVHWIRHGSTQKHGTLSSLIRSLLGHISP